MSRPKVTDEQVREIITMYSLGYSVAAISRKVGVTRHTVDKYVAPYVEGRTLVNQARSAEVANRYNEMVRMYEAGASLAKIGKKHNISRQRVHQIISSTGKRRRVYERTENR